MIKKIIDSSLFKASGVYTLSSVISSAIPFFLLPVLTRFLSPEDYGIVAMYTLLLSITSVFTGLSVHGAINRAYFDNSVKHYKEYIWNCLIILIISSLFTLILYFLLRNQISKWTGIPKEWIWTVVLISFFQFIILSLLAVYQARMQSKKYMYFQVSIASLNICLSLFFVVLLLMKWEGRILAQIVSTVLIGLLASFILIKEHIYFKLNAKYIKHSLQFGIPLIPYTLGGMLMTLSDRFIINRLLGTKEVGIYMVGLQLGTILGILSDAFNKAYAPWLFSKLNVNNDVVKEKIIKFTYLYFICIILLAFFLNAIIVYLLPMIIGEKFLQSKNIIIWILLGNAFNGMYYMVTNYIFYVYKTYLLAIISFFVGIVNVPLTYFFVRLNGIVGASISYMLSMILMFLLTWFLSIKVYSMPWKLERLKK